MPKAVDVTNIYTWRDAGGTSYYVKGTLPFPARVELAQRTAHGEEPVVFDVLAHREPGGSSPAGHEFIAWGATRPQAEVEIRGRTRIWRSTVDQAKPWIIRVEPQHGEAQHGEAQHGEPQK